VQRSRNNLQILALYSVSTCSSFQAFLRRCIFNIFGFFLKLNINALTSMAVPTSTPNKGISYKTSDDHALPQQTITVRQHNS
jgi:hypothetical protein